MQQEHAWIWFGWMWPKWDHSTSNTVNSSNRSSEYQEHAMQCHRTVHGIVAVGKKREVVGKKRGSEAGSHMPAKAHHICT